MTDRGQQFDSLQKIAAARRPPIPWQDGDKIPWHDPEFSRRLMAVHLDQANHMASRSLDVIGQHVAWLLEVMDAGRGRPGPWNILDLGCGPGFYCHELARLGHPSVGVDFSPAAISHAKMTSEIRGFPAVFHEADLLDSDAPWLSETGTFDAVTFWFGEFNAFPAKVAGDLLTRMVKLLKPGGLFVLEYQPLDLFLREDEQEWRVCDRSVFSDEPHLWLQEYHWDEKTSSEINVHWIMDAKTGQLTHYAQCNQAWSDEELMELLHDAGLEAPMIHPPVTGCDKRLEFPLVVASRPR